MIDFKNAAELLELCDTNRWTISRVMRQRECDLGETGNEQIQSRMSRVLEIMKDSALSPLKSPVTSMGGLIGGQAEKLNTLYEEGKSICGDVLSTGITYAMAVTSSTAMA